jgi:hypothetical protein
MGYERETQLLQVNVSNVRRKIEPDPSRPSHIITEVGAGGRSLSAESEVTAGIAISSDLNLTNKSGHAIISPVYPLGVYEIWRKELRAWNRPTWRS